MLAAFGAQKLKGFLELAEATHEKLNATCRSPRTLCVTQLCDLPLDSADSTSKPPPLSRVVPPPPRVPHDQLHPVLRRSLGSTLRQLFTTANAADADRRKQDATTPRESWWQKCCCCGSPQPARCLRRRGRGGERASRYRVNENEEAAAVAVPAEAPRFSW